MPAFQPGPKPAQVSSEVWDFAGERHVRLADDLQALGAWLTPLLVKVDGQPEHRVHKPEQGLVDYSVGRIDYVSDPDGERRVHGSRTVTTVAPGSRTETVYWRHGAPFRQIETCKGVGRIIFGGARSHWALQRELSEGSPPALIEEATAFTVIAHTQEEPVVISELYHQPLNAPSNPKEWTVGSWEFKTIMPHDNWLFSTPDGQFRAPRGLTATFGSGAAILH